MDSARAAGLATELSARFGEERAVAGSDRAAAVAGAGGLIHYILTGKTKPPGLPLSPDLLLPALWVAKITYFPLEEELPRVACGLGRQTLDGGGMAVFQSREAYPLYRHGAGCRTHAQALHINVG